MPTYQYACTNPEGKHEFEVVQSFTDAPVSECPECGAPVRKVYGSVGVVFKGSGFYRTDSRKAGAAAEGSGKEGSSSEKSPASSEKSASAGGKDGGSSAKPKESASSTAGSGAKAAG